MHDVISTFLDNEPFDPRELSASLGTPEGRDLLLDLIALRTVVQPAAPASVNAPAPARVIHWSVAAAAAVVLLASGYLAGRQTAPVQDAAIAAAVTAPEPTAVMKFESGVNWKESTTRPGGN
jgi:hypothetical protein